MTLPEELRDAAEKEMPKWGSPAYLLRQAADRIEELEREKQVLTNRIIEIGEPS